MRYKRKTAALLCGVLLLAGCGNAKTQENTMDTAGEAERPVQTEETLQEDGDIGAQADRDEKGDGAVVIEAGPDKKIYEAGSVTYTLYDFKLYESPEEAGIDPNEMLTIDAKYYMDRSIFLTVQADLRNIDYTGGDKEGEINVSQFTIAPNQQDETLQWEGSYPVYLSEHGTEETDYYHVYVKPGEVKTVTLGFYVPVKDAGELRSRCKISLYGSYDEGYVYEIPKVQ